MLSKHGSLESSILCTLWDLEAKGIYANTVKKVFETLSQNELEKRAYTTIKTVMDRLVEKKVLLRFKQGKKFNYRTAYSNNEIITNSLIEIANRYCQGNLEILSQAIRTISNKELISA